MKNIMISSNTKNELELNLLKTKFLSIFREIGQGQRLRK